MKKIFALLLIAGLTAFTDVRDPLTEKERKFAADFLTQTRNTLVDLTKGLSEQQ